MTSGQLIVVALGGNAISKPDEEGTVEQQWANSRVTARHLANLIADGHRLVITHGNGPQIGNTLLRNEMAAGKIYPIPMPVAVADVQGGMGFMIAQTLTNELQKRGMDRVVTAIITTVLVGKDDPAFANPTKPVGRMLSPEEAERFRKDEGWQTKEVQPGRFRRVVPSPYPKRIVEIETIRRAVDADDLIVACGGGGIPVLDEPGTGLRGVPAVIDKDLASALLAADLNADTIVFLTGVDRVAINFGKPNQRDVERMSITEARKWLNEGQFPPGSMGPKVQGAIDFLESSKKPTARAMIGPLDGAAETLAGATGTMVTRD